MTQDETSIAHLFEPELGRIRAEFGDRVVLEVVSLLADQLAAQVKEYEAEGRYLWQRFGRNPTYTVAVDFAAITQDLRAYQREQAAAQLAQLRLIAAHN